MTTKIGSEETVSEPDSINRWKPAWVKMKPFELESIIVDLAKQGESPSKIGMILRDKHGVPRVKLFGKRVVKVLKEKGIPYKSEKDFVSAEIERLKQHSGKNKRDHSASRAITKKLWGLYKLEKRQV